MDKHNIKSKFKESYEMSENKIPKSGKQKPLDASTCQATEEDKGG
jgi:hypothetical protein